MIDLNPSRRMGSPSPASVSKPRAQSVRAVRVVEPARVPSVPSKIEGNHFVAHNHSLARDAVASEANLVRANTAPIEPQWYVPNDIDKMPAGLGPGMGPSVAQPAAPTVAARVATNVTQRQTDTAASAAVGRAHHTKVVAERAHLEGASANLTRFEQQHAAALKVARAEADKRGDEHNRSSQKLATLEHEAAGKPVTRAVAKKLSDAEMQVRAERKEMLRQGFAARMREAKAAKAHAALQDIRMSKPAPRASRPASAAAASAAGAAAPRSASTGASGNRSIPMPDGKNLIIGPGADETVVRAFARNCPNASTAHIVRAMQDGLSVTDAGVWSRTGHTGFVIPPPYLFPVRGEATPPRPPASLMQRQPGAPR